MVSIPCLILVRDPQLISKVKDELKNIEGNEEHEGRSWIVETVPANKYFDDLV
jgi:hypothetical protein